MAILKLLIKSPEHLKMEIIKVLEKNKKDFEKVNKLTARFNQHFIFGYSLNEKGFVVEILAPKLNNEKIIKSFYKENKLFKECEIGEINNNNEKTPGKIF